MWGEVKGRSISTSTQLSAAHSDQETMIDTGSSREDLQEEDGSRIREAGLAAGSNASQLSWASAREKTPASTVWSSHDEKGTTSVATSIATPAPSRKGIYWDPARELG
ncbi:hypothetical protein QFC19_004193 [Naganishia cerealis]|uniref:Uncharacterized protein n=1 Tax=Naganishia cerealis TaxID=610337 RepID=A0ACC2VWS1_9TREE|nr:hypothetical protein QFC19_004193 [Naganishia cerealis]